MKGLIVAGFMEWSLELSKGEWVTIDYDVCLQSREQILECVQC